MELAHVIFWRSNSILLVLLKYKHTTPKACFRVLTFEYKFLGYPLLLKEYIPNNALWEGFSVPKIGCSPAVSDGLVLMKLRSFKSALLRLCLRRERSETKNTNFCDNDVLQKVLGILGQFSAGCRGWMVECAPVPVFDCTKNFLTLDVYTPQQCSWTVFCMTFKCVSHWRSADLLRCGPGGRLIIHLIT